MYYYHHKIVSWTLKSNRIQNKTVIFQKLKGEISQNIFRFKLNFKKKKTKKQKNKKTKVFLLSRVANIHTCHMGDRGWAPEWLSRLSVQLYISHSGHDLMVVISSHVWSSPLGMEPAWDSLSPSLFTSPLLTYMRTCSLLLSLSLSLSKIKC